VIYDYIVIGSGFGGSVASLRLVEKGYKVLLLEQGKRYDPRDFPKTNWNLPRYLWLPGLRFFGIQKLTLIKEASILSGTGFGGGSLVYANTLYIPNDDFFNGSSWAKDGGWKRTLMPFYDKASFMLGRTRYTRLNPEDIALHDVANDMNCGPTFESVHVGVNLSGEEAESDPYFGGLGPMRKGCIECGGCMAGCRENAKNSLDRNYLWFAEKLGLEVLVETKAEIISRSGEVYTVGTRSTTSFPGKKRRVFQSKGIVVAAGTLGTIDLLLRQKHKFRTLPDLSDTLGNNVRTNAETLCAVSSAREKLNNGLAITSVFSPDPHTRAEVVKYSDGSNAMKWFFGLSADGSSGPIPRPLRLLFKTVTHPRQFFKTLFNFKWSTKLAILLVMQTADNAMKLEWKKSLTGSRMKLVNKGRNKVPAYIPVGQEVLERYARKVDGIPQNILLEVFLNRPTTAHILGGCPMGDSALMGVIGKNLKVHGYPDFYITDGSIVQGNIGVNPSLTIAALAEYAMESIPPAGNSEVHSISRKLLQMELEWKMKRSD